MSSETSTSEIAPTERAPERTGQDDQGMLPWQLYAIAGLVGATIVVVLSRGQSVPVVILLSLTIFAAAAVGHAALRTLLPLAGHGFAAIVAPVLGGRARTALEREKALVLRTIKELEFDRAMGKVSAPDFDDMSLRLRGRAARLIQRLDARTDYRAQIEQEIQRRLGRQALATPGCPSCSSPNDADARFCKRCGHRLVGG